MSKIRFLHCADLHLGHGQSDIRKSDFVDAWRWVVDTAKKEQVDLIILAGDLFDSVRPSPEIFAKAHEIAVFHNGRWYIMSGNHDRRGAGGGWTAVLADLLDSAELYRTISLDGIDDAVRISASDASTIESQVEEIRGDLADAPADVYRVAVIHAGLQPQMSELRGGYDPEVLAPLKGEADYVAMGHCHAAGSYGGWAHWPGSPEWTQVTQYQETGGVIIAEATRDDDGPWRTSTRHIPYPWRRPLMTLSIDVSATSSPGDLGAILAAEVKNFLGKVVDVRISGVLPWSRSALDIRVLKSLILSAGAIEAYVRDETSSIDAHVETEMDEDREQMYRRVISEMLAQDKRWREQTVELLESTISIMRLIRNGIKPADILAAVPMPQEVSHDHH